MAPTIAVLLLAICVRTAIVFVLLIIAMRMTGQRQMGEIDTKDVVVVMLISNAVQNSMTLGIGMLSVAFAAAGTISLLAWLFGVVVARRPNIQRSLMGTPTVLVFHGKLIDKNMRSEGVTDNQLMGEIRNSGVEDVSKVRLAVLETDGTISIIHDSRAMGAA
jgi:uncharacterized membrane protein YcaP (DUF421 family)